ncbi:uncharacterized protein si:cabz01007807.1 [Silurus meridionalis]|uniref:Apolipoprotein L domain-containing protein 1 n=1 Tax=Silurus meridionalis TaxID=175797 RepID=A0A8T0A4W0_SILME|nr:uncharacterized protein si:cabz01007807.1 [Silurus meridionalis]KAF7686829.1 hypothetical protein HF521_015222 [Silurus meridionalis]
MEVRGDHVGRLNEAGSGDRRPENIFLDVSSNGTQASGSQITQNDFQKSGNPFLHPAQNTENGFSSTNTNPFLTQGKDSNGNTVSTDEYDLLLSNGQSNGWPHFLTSSTPSFKNDWAVFPPPNLSKDTNQTPFQKWDSFQDSFSARISPPRTSNQMTNIFEPFKEETSVSPRMPANEKTSDESDFFLEYMLANQKNDVESVSSTSASNHLNLFEEKFLPSPIIDDNIFTNTASFQSSDIFQTPGSSMQNNPLDQTSASVQYDHSKLSVNSAVNNGQFKPQDSDFDKLFMTTDMSNGLSQETSTLPPFLNASKDLGLMFRRRPPKPTPRIKARKNSLKNQNINHDLFSTSAESVPTDQKPAQTLFPPNPPLPISKPTVPKPPTNIQGSMLPGATKQSQVYEDVLFIGQEKCVEDWPEDSPELSPDWKPSGKLKLRRESLRIAAESEADTIGRKSGKTKLKLMVSRRKSKDTSGDDTRVLQTSTVCESEQKYPDNITSVYGDTLPWGKKFNEPDDVFLPEQEDHNANMKGKSVKIKKPKFIVPHLQYKGSKEKSLSESFENKSPFQHNSKVEHVQELYGDKLKNVDHTKPVMKDWRLKDPHKLKPSLPHRLSKDFIEDDLKKMNGLSFLEESKENVSASAEKENHRYSADLWAEYQLETCSSKPPDNSKKTQDLQDCRPKKSFTFRVPHMPRKGSKSTPENDIPEKGADLFKATDIQGLEMNVSEDYNQMRKSPVQRVSPIIRRDSQGLNNAEKGADLFKAGDIADDIWMEKHTMDTKTEKVKNETLPRSESKAKDQLYFTEDFELPGATSGDYYLSEAAKAEWMSSQMDLRRVKTPEHAEKLEGVKEEEEGDTDSLMEWWNTVELWDELPSDDESNAKEDETKSFTEIADKVHQGLRVFYKVFTEQAEVLYLHVLRLYAIGDDLSNFHRRAKIANITGGTTSAVGGAAVITGLALAPVTLGASLIVSAVGLGVAAAGGITAASATLSDNVHEMSDRKKIEVVLQDYETRLVELRRCLHFVAEGVRRMRLHPLLRRNNYYAGDWEVRRALQTISLVGDPVEQAEEIVQKSTMALNSVYKGMDNYFSKDSKELKKGCKKEVTMQVNMLAKLLHENLVVLNSTREHLMEATGFV